MDNVFGVLGIGDGSIDAISTMKDETRIEIERQRMEIEALEELDDLLRSLIRTNEEHKGRVANIKKRMRMLDQRL